MRQNYHRVPRIRENRVPRIREIGSLQVHTGYLTFSLKKNWCNIRFCVIDHAAASFWRSTCVQVFIHEETIRLTWRATRSLQDNSERRVLRERKKPFTSMTLAKWTNEKTARLSNVTSFVNALGKNQSNERPRNHRKMSSCAMHNSKTTDSCVAIICVCRYKGRIQPLSLGGRFQ